MFYLFDRYLFCLFGRRLETWVLTKMITWLQISKQLLFLQSLFEAKGIAGNIIAGLIVIEAIKVIQNDSKSCRWAVFLICGFMWNLLLVKYWTYLFCNFVLQNDLLSWTSIKEDVEPFEPKKACYVCSEVSFYIGCSRDDTGTVDN